MFRKIPYTDQELRVVGSIPLPRNRSLPVYNCPVSSRTNFEAYWPEKHPYYMMDIREISRFDPPIYSKTLGRSNKEDQIDIFGIKWTFEPTAGGSIVMGGTPILEDVNDWKEVIKIPDIDQWDWQGTANENTFDMSKGHYLTCANGFWFERLISFMDFMNAAMALIDEDQQDAVKELFAAMTDLGCKLVDKLCEFFPALDAIEVHDDWGSQKAPFFSQEVAEEYFVPFMKQLTDRIHAHGRVAMLHSCGHNIDRVQCYIDGGFDMWSPQDMNDIDYLYDNYGDKIIFGVFPKETNLADLSEEEQREAARRFVDRYNQPGKPTFCGPVCSKRSTPAFREEVYIYSRKKYQEW